MRVSKGQLVLLPDDNHLQERDEDVAVLCPVNYFHLQQLGASSDEPEKIPHAVVCGKQIRAFGLSLSPKSLILRPLVLEYRAKSNVLRLKADFCCFNAYGAFTSKDIYETTEPNANSETP